MDLQRPKILKSHAMSSKGVLLITGDKKISLTLAQLMVLVEERGLRVKKVAEQESFDIYKEVSIRELSKKSHKSQKASLKVYYFSPISSGHDIGIKIRKVQDSVDRGKQVKLILTSHKARQLRKYDRITIESGYEAIKQSLERIFKGRLICVGKNEFTIRK